MNIIRALFVGTNHTIQKKKTYIDNVLKFDRILDADHKIYIGIGKQNVENPTQSLQVIRIGDYTNKYYRLLNFKEEENKLKYTFENDIILILKKTNENNVLLKLVDLCNNIIISKNIDPIIIKFFKPISLSKTSDEFDKIHKLFNTDFESLSRVKDNSYPQRSN